MRRRERDKRQCRKKYCILNDSADYRIHPIVCIHVCFWYIHVYMYTCTLYMELHVHVYVDSTLEN